MLLSISLRALVDLESLNSIESVGALVRHRTASITVPTERGYDLKIVPAISGEAIAHAYQEKLVEEALKRGLPVGVYSRRGEFIKFADNGILGVEGVDPPSSEEDIQRTEIDIMLKDIVADIGGFLYAEDYPVKRTSTFSVSYMCPTLDSINATSLEPQLHARHIPSEVKRRTARGEAARQMIYDIEVGSGLFAFTFILDINKIASPANKFGFVPSDKVSRLQEERRMRIETALTALLKLLSSLDFGAKRSRFFPHLRILSAVAALSKGCNFIVSSGFSRDYITKTVQRAESYLKAVRRLGNNSDDVKIYIYDEEGLSGDLENVERHDTIEGLLSSIIDEVVKSLGGD